MTSSTSGGALEGWRGVLPWAALYLLAGVLTALSQPQLGQAPWYPPTAIGIAFFLLRGRRWWPVVLAMELLVSWLQYRSAAPALVSATVTTAEQVLGASLLVLWRFDRSFRSLDDVLRLMVVAGTVAVVAAGPGTLLVRAVGFENGTLLEMARVWFVGEMTAVIVLLPVLLLIGARWSDFIRDLRALPGWPTLELTSLLVIGVGMVGAVFFAVGSGPLAFAEVGAVLVCLLPVLWVAVRFGRADTAGYALLVDVAALAAVSLSHHGVAVSVADDVAVQLFMLVASLAGLGVAVAVDATAAAQASERAVSRDRELLIAAIEQAAEGVIVTDATPAIVYANPAAVAFSGYQLDELVGQNPRLFRSGRQDARFYRAMWAELAVGRSWHGTLVNRRKDGVLYEQENTISPVLDDAGEITAYVAVKRDLSRERSLEADLVAQELERRRLADVLVGVGPNERPEQVATELCRVATQVDGILGAVIMRTLPDGRLLVLSSALPSSLPLPVVPLAADVSAILSELTAGGPWSMDWTGELWGDGPVTGAMSAGGVTALAGVPIRWQGRMVGILLTGTSDAGGPAVLDRSRAGMVEIAAHASALLGPQLATLDDREAGRERVTDLIDHRRFRPVFQPVVSLETGATVGYEALTRFHDGTRPDLVFGEAHAVGLGHDLERACLAASVAAAADLPATAWLSLNVSPTLVLADGLRHVLDGVARPLVLEVTEHVEVPDYAELRRALNGLGDVRVAVDDAGAGYASLRHILELRPDIVKLDLALVRGIDADPARQALVAGMHHFAAETLTHLLAEGVETRAEADTVRRLGVELGQGYLFGRPEALPPVVGRGRLTALPDLGDVG